MFTNSPVLGLGGIGSWRSLKYPPHTELGLGSRALKVPRGCFLIGKGRVLLWDLEKGVWELGALGRI